MIPDMAQARVTLHFVEPFAPEVVVAIKAYGAGRLQYRIDAGELSGELSGCHADYITHIEASS